MNDYTANEIEIKNGGELVEKFCLRPKHYAALRLMICGLVGKYAKK